MAGPARLPASPPPRGLPQWGAPKDDSRVGGYGSLPHAPPTPPPPLPCALNAVAGEGARARGYDATAPGRWRLPRAAQPPPPPPGQLNLWVVPYAGRNPPGKGRGPPQPPPPPGMGGVPLLGVATVLIAGG